MFAQLDVKSAYSLLDGTMSVETIIKNAVDHGYKAIAILDEDVMFNVMEFHHCAKKYNIKPLYGLRIRIQHKEDTIPYLLIAKNNEAYQDLMKLSSRLSVETPTFDLLLEYSNQCIIIVYGEAGIIEHEKIDTLAYLDLYQRHFDDFYIALSNNRSIKWKEDNQRLKQLCENLGIKTVAVPKVEFEKADDQDAKKLFSALKHNRQYHDYSNVVNEYHYFLSLAEIKEQYDADDIERTIEIANKCQVDFNLLEKAHLPQYKEDQDSNQYLRSLCQLGLKRRLNNNVSKIYWDRLSYELNVITSMGYADYFLIVYDFILYAKRQGIYVGPGRGSSASSLVAYVLGITEIDPIEHNLLFERFLNPERVTLPDIDIDFPDRYRDDIINYVKEKYGAERVAHIITFDTFGAKQAIRDVGRVLNVPNYKLDQLSNHILNTPKAGLKDSYDNNVNLRVLLQEDQSLKEVWRLAQKIEGLPRHSSMHAAGIVLADKALVEYIPLINQNNHTLTQYSMDYLEALGLNKMDFLGLKNLTIIMDVVAHLENFDISNIPFDDKKTFELLSRADTTGIFQLESAGMRKLLKDMKPYQFDDIVAAIALYRPGPMANIPTFLRRRAKKEKIRVYHESLRPVLESTYGIIVYQEQIMQIAQIMAGFSLAKADLLRKAMSDKDHQQLLDLKDDFIRGSVQRGYTKKEANEIYELIEKFADYGFNKAHSVAYSTIAYQMAYLKANFPEIFYLAILESVKGGQAKTNAYINECQNKNIKILKPSVNESGLNYQSKNSAILLPLTAIKGVGQAGAKKIIEERKADGNFKSYPNFIARANLRGISKNTLESLIHAGALDCFNYSRKTMLENLDNVLIYADVMKVNVDPPYLDYDIISEEPKISLYADNKMEVLEMEYETLGFYLSSHPIEEKKAQYNYQGDTIRDVREKKITKRLLVQVVNIKEHRTKYGDLMAFIAVRDETDFIDLVVMPDLYKKRKDVIKKQAYLLVQGRSDRENSILIQRLEVVK